MSRPNPAVGAVLVSAGGIVLGRGWTQSGGRPHAEAAALAEAGGNAAGATLYVTLEPCAHRSARGPACARLVAEARVARVVFAVEDPDPRTAGAGAQMLRRAGVRVDRLRCDASRRSLAGYLTRAAFGRPYVTLKLAMTLDGRIALPDGTSRWITGKAARRHVHAQRARQDAILVGAATWRTDNPALDVRLAGLEHLSPVRVVLTRAAAPAGVTALPEPAAIGTLADCQYLYVEGGARTAAAFLEADLVDQLDIYRAPALLGAGRGGVADLGIEDLAAIHGRWACTVTRQLGTDRFESYERIRKEPS